MQALHTFRSFFSRPPKLGRVKLIYAIVGAAIVLVAVIGVAVPSRKAVANSSLIPAEVASEPARFGERVVVRTANASDSRVSLSSGLELLTSYKGPNELQYALEQNSAEPRSLAAADFDEDGVPDLVSGYAYAGRGIVTVHRGNVDSIYPNAPEAQARKANNTFTDAPFLSPALAVEVAAPADFLGAGDFDADGHWDIVVASRGSSSLHFLSGDGKGSFAPEKEVSLDGNLTAFTTGEINRRDGLTDIVVGVDREAGARVLVFEGPDGAMRASPESFRVPDVVTSLALGQLDQDYAMDLAVASGTTLLVVHGRDRKLTLPAKDGAAVLSARVNERAFPFALRTVVVGDFGDAATSDLAVLGDDGTVRVLSSGGMERRNKSVSKEVANWQSETLSVADLAGANSLVCVRVSTMPGDDLLVLDQVGQHMQVITGAASQSTQQARERLRESFPVDGAPVSALPMRLDPDALTDLVILRTGASAPAILRTFAARKNVAESIDSPQSGLFSNPAAITVPNSGSPPIKANLYPSTINVSGQSGPVDKVRVRLNDLSVSSVDWLDILLVSPGGQKAIVMSDAAFNNSVTNLFITFDDDASQSVAAPLASGTYKPTDINSGAADVFPAPAPAGPYATTFSTFNGTDPNGTWSLYLVNDAANFFNPGNINGGWQLILGNPPPVNFVVTNTNDTGAGSFRQAIIDANLNPGADLITFQIGSGQQTIAPLSPLPIVTDPVTIDGTTQPGFAGTPLIEINGVNAGSFAGVIAGGVEIRAGSSVVRGLVLNRFNNSGVALQQNGNNIIEGNFVGTDLTGTVRRTNSDGVTVNSAGNTIGGTTAAARNLISGNNGSEVLLAASANNTLIQGNFMGTDVTGMLRLDCQQGVSSRSVPGSPNNTIGGTTAGARNVLSGNFFANVDLVYSGSTGNLVQGNYIGTNVNGTGAVQNTGDGVGLESAQNNTIGGTTPAARNIISGNYSSGVFIRDPGTTGNLIEGNYIGTDVTGTAPLNTLTGNGVNMIFSATTNTIGGAITAARNIISGNAVRGISVGAPLRDTTINNLIQGNFIGTDVSGAVPLANGGGVSIPANATSDRVISNRIAFNNGNGVELTTPTNPGDSPALKIEVTDNEIYANHSLGIDLGPAGITPNDNQDPDSGPNNLQNFPVLTNYSLNTPGHGPNAVSTTLTVNGTLNSTPNTVFTVHWIFSTDSQCTNNQFLTTPLAFGRIPGVLTDGNGNAPFSFPFSFPPGTNRGVINTEATDAEGNTSEFSSCLPVTSIPAVSINDINQNEGNGGTTAFTFTVSLSTTSSETVTVNFATANGTATTADNDYSLSTGVVTFSPGETSKPLTVLVNGDTKFEPNETFFVNLSTPTNATIADSQGQGTILNDDLQPTISINDIGQSEGNSGTTLATFAVSLSNSSSQIITVNYATANGTATTADNDYSSTSGTLTFNPGDTSKQINVSVFGDVKFERDETYFVNISAPTNATMRDGQGQDTIQNDDLQPTISINDVSHSEGNAGTTSFAFTVSLTNASSQTITVVYATANGTGTTADSDYSATGGTLTFNPGDTSEPITVLVNGDTLNEPDENFFVNLSNGSNATIADAQGLGTISNDDPVPTLSLNDMSVAEGNSGTSSASFTVTLSAASGQTVTVQYATADGTATAGSDYQNTSGSLTFNPGDTTKTITVAVNGDTANEPNETFFVNLSSAVNATIADNQGIGTILNDDGAPTLAITDVTVAEGNSGTTNATFTVSLSPASGQTATVNYATADGTATAGSDYQTASGTLTFNAGETSKPITVQVNGDLLNEPDETFFVNLSSATNATIIDSQGMGTITNDDAVPSLSINDVSAAEGNSGSSSATFMVSLSAASGQTVTVNYATADGTATAGNDYQATSGSLTFNPGETGKSITVLVNGDTAFEPNETFVVNLSSATNATISDSQGISTILNDDLQPAISITDVIQGEGNSGTTSFTFTVSLTNASSQTITVNYATAAATATAGSDYQSASGTLTFNAGETSKPVTVLVNGDMLNEPDETFLVNLSSPTNATITDSQGVGTIQNDDAMPSLGINDVSVAEANSGTSNASFTVTLSAASGQTVTVNYATADGTATTAGSDYQATSGSLTFNPGDTTKTITVVVNGDTANEPNETFFVNLSGAVNATIADNQGMGTILNDDPVPGISLNDVTANEGNSGTTSFTFTVSLTNASSQTITVNYATADVTATAGSDYQATSGTLTFNAGETSKPVTVLVNGDVLNEPDESFFVNLSSATNATITDSQGVGTIQNDDAMPSLGINDVSVAEGNSGTTNATFTVTLSAASGRTVAVQYATADGIATTADNDYVSHSGTLSFNPGDTSKSITVLINGDTANEPNETFFVNLSSASNATIADNQGQGTILNDDGAPSLAINDVTITEGDSGTTNATFTVSLSPASGQTVTVNYATADGTALSSSDYQAKTGSLTFNPGDTSKPITVLVNGDTLNEPDETFSVNLSNGSNATIVDNQGVGTIANDDAVPQLSINDVSVTEGNSGTTNATFTVALSAISGQAVTVNYATADGTATAGSDYQSSSGSLTFNPGETSKPITVLVNGDTAFELDETFFVNLSAVVNATIGDGQGQGTIQNEDLQPTISINDIGQGEGNSGTTSFTFTVSLSNASSQTITVNFATADGTATAANNDYATTSGTLTFNPGDTGKPITVAVNGDVLNELDENFFVNLSGATNATIADNQGIGTITNDDAVPSLSLNDVSVTEGNSGTTNATFSVTLSAASGRTVTVNYLTADNTATAGSDYQTGSGTLTFNPGDTSKSITVVVNGDNIDESNETFFVNLSTATNAIIADNQGVGTITNDDPVPSLALNDMTANEGNSGTTSFTFIVSLSNPSWQSVTVNYATANGTATAGSDYQSVSGTLTFNPGDTSKSISVLVNGDTLNEPDETFLVNLSNAGNATIADNQGLGTITNDDAAPSLALNDVGVAEGNTGNTNATFTVSLSAVSGQTVTVQYATADGTATASSDYQSLSGTVTFNPGDTSKPITVLVNGDTLNEADETFFVNLSSATSATIADNQGVGTILNDDAAPTPTPTPTPTPAGYTPAGSNVTVQGNGVEITFAQVNSAGITTMNSIAPASAGPLPANYVINGSSLAFDLNTSAGYAPPIDLCFAMPAVTDATAFSVLAIMHNEGGTLVDRTTTRDFAAKKICGRVNSLSPFAVVSKVTLQLSAATFNGGENVGSIPVTVIRTSDTSGLSTVGYTTSDSGGANNCNVLNSGNASSRCDYETTAGMLHFAVGETSKTILIPIIDDVYAEGGESFTVTLSNASGASLGSPAVATVNITDNEMTTGTNPINIAAFFVRLHYVDFFTREPDPGGQAFWTDQITSCGTDQACTEIRRINVSAAFYLSIEFQDTGYLVYRMYKAAYGNIPGLPVPVRFNEFLPDTQQIGQGVVVGQTGWEQVLENNKVAFATDYVMRSRFVTAYPTTRTPAQFVDALYANAGVTPSASERSSVISEFGSATSTVDTAARGRALRLVAENATLKQQETNRAFVLMQYFGYLRRNPDDPPEAGLNFDGYNFWLAKLNQFGGNFVNAEMVKAFIVSGEYKQRFGP